MSKHDHKQATVWSSDHISSAVAPSLPQQLLKDFFFVLFCLAKWRFISHNYHLQPIMQWSLSHLKTRETLLTWMWTDTPVFKSWFVWSTPEFEWALTPLQVNHIITAQVWKQLLSAINPANIKANLYLPSACPYTNLFTHPCASCWHNCTHFMRKVFSLSLSR